MGTCYSKNNLKQQLLDQDNIIISKVDFEDKIKSKFSISEEVDGLECVMKFIFEIKNQNLYPIDNNKLVSCNYHNLQFITIKNAILESEDKKRTLILINKILNEIHTDYLFSVEDKSIFYVFCNYLYHHKNYLQMI